VGSGWSSTRRLVVPAALAVLVMFVLSLAVVPTRTYFEQRGQIALAEERLGEMVERNTRSAERIAALDTDDELERRARQDLRLARPGEEVYTVLPPPPPPPSVPGGWPFGELADRVASPAP
jgi:cell division protein FtsB